MGSMLKDLADTMVGCLNSDAKPLFTIVYNTILPIPGLYHHIQKAMVVPQVILQAPMGREAGRGRTATAGAGAGPAASSTRFRNGKVSKEHGCTRHERKGLNF